MNKKSNTLPVDYRLHQYRIESVLGAGGFGITYKAVHEALQTRAAIKEYFPVEWSYRDHDEVNVLANTQGTLPTSDAGGDVCYTWGLERFLKEARILAQVNHPGVVRVRDFFEANGTAYIVMDYEDGEPLSQTLQREKTLPEDRVRRLLTDVLPALDAVHAMGYLHRDLKPANLYCRSDGRTILIDFGAARQALSQRSKNITSVFTVGYSPIEQYLVESKGYGPWTDIYALGAVLYQCVTGRQPVEAPARVLDDPLKPAEVVAAGRYSSALLQVIDRSMAVRPEQRFQTITQMREALEGGETVILPPMPLRPELPSPPPPQYCLTVEADPPQAIVRLLNSQTPYQPGMALPPGDYQIEVALDGYATNRLPVRIANTNVTLPVRLKKTMSLNWRWGAALAVVAAILGGVAWWWSQPKPAEKYALTVKTDPAGANVRLLNSPTPYQPGVRLAPGNYEIEVMGEGYVMRKVPVRIVDGAVTVPVTLEKQSLPPQSGQNYTDAVTGMEFVWIQPGCFTMGSPPTEKDRYSNEIPHQVCPQGFWMGQYEVTNAQYQLFDAKHDSGAYEAYTLNSPEQPVARVSWQEAVAYADWLSGKTGLRFRLPTEAEWEYAARAGKTHARPWGDELNQACRYANVYDETARKAKPLNWPNYPCEDGQIAAAPVGKYAANPFGLFDMLGNVAEWTCSEYDSAYAGGETRCAEPKAAGGRRVLRGGAWSDYPGLMRLAYRFPAAPDYRKFDWGFRLALAP